MRRLFLIAGIAILVRPGCARAQQRFEVAVWGHYNSCSGFPGPFTPLLHWINPESIDYREDTHAIASGDGRRVLAIVPKVPVREEELSVRIMDVSPSGERVLFFDGAPGHWADAIAVTPTGRVFVHAVKWDEQKSVLVTISPAGVLETVRPFPVLGGGLFDNAIAMAHDGCTLLYKNKKGIGRFNACTGSTLADFMTSQSDVLDFDPTGTGDVLVSDLEGIHLHSASGARLRTVARMTDYGFSQGDGAGQIAMARDGRSIWFATLKCFGGGLLQISFPEGRELARHRLSTNFPSSLVVGLVPSSVPAVDPHVLVLMVLALAIVGVRAARL